LNGAVPGIIMEANPDPDAYARNSFAGQAEDTAWIVNRRRTVSVTYGKVRNVLTSLEATRLEPGAYDQKSMDPVSGSSASKSLTGDPEVAKLESVSGRSVGDAITVRRMTDGPSPDLATNAAIPAHACAVISPCSSEERAMPRTTSGADSSATEQSSQGLRLDARRRGGPATVPIRPIGRCDWHDRTVRRPRRRNGYPPAIVAASAARAIITSSRARIRSIAGPLPDTGTASTSWSESAAASGGWIRRSQAGRRRPSGWSARARRSRR